MRRTPYEPPATRAVFAILANAARPVMNLLMSHTWVGMEKIPDGCIVVSNHNTEIDPLVVGHALYASGKYPRFLAKKSLFSVPVVGKLLSLAGMVPVDRGGPGAGTSLDVATTQLERGGCIVVYPEGTLTRDPDLWPMRGHSGAARLALRTGAPVIPVVHWGDHELFPRYGKMFRPFPRKRVVVTVGEPIDLSEYSGQPLTRKVMLAATDTIIRAITADLVKLRGGTPPEHPWDPSVDGAGEAGRRNLPQGPTTASGIEGTTAAAPQDAPQETTKEDDA